MMEFQDQLGRLVHLPAVPKRILSTVPSQTEFLFDLGLNDEVVGITKFCVHPADKWRSTERIGGTKTLDLAKIKSLRPDLIISNKEENNQAQIEALAEEFPVWISDVQNLEGAFDMMTDIGELVGKKEEAIEIRNTAEQSWNAIKGLAQPVKVAYCIWNEPLMFASDATFIDAVLIWLGFENVAKAWEGRYSEADMNALSAAAPEIVFLSSEPFPFGEKHQKELAEQSTNISRGFPLVNGEMFSWYGSRLVPAAAYLKQLLKELNLKTS